MIMFVDLTCGDMKRGFSSVGRASALHAEGHGFDSRNLHSRFARSTFALIHFATTHPSKDLILPWKSEYHT